MHKILVAIVVSLILSSCATLTLRKKQTIFVFSNSYNAKAKIKDSIYNLPAKIKIERSNKDLKIMLYSDSIRKEFTLRPSLNPTFLYQYNLWWFIPYNYLIDLTNPKRFYYQEKVMLNPNDSNSIILTPLAQQRQLYAKATQSRKGQINAFISFPWVNNFYQQPMNETPKSNTGFWGISGGAEYYYKKNRYICFSYSAVMDLFVPVPAAVDIWGEHQAVSSSYLTLNDNFKMNRISLGYGLNYSRTSWNLLDIEQPVTQPLASSSKYTTTCAFGITLNSYYQLTRGFYMGIIYRPTLLNVYPKTELKYQHLISLDLMWKFRIKK